MAYEVRGKHFGTMYTAPSELAPSWEPNAIPQKKFLEFLTI